MTAKYAQCRYAKRTGERCTAEVIDPDPEAVQICPSHALRAAQLLAESGAIHIKAASPTRRSKA